MSRRKGQGSLDKNQMELGIALSKSLEESKARELSKLADELPADAIEEGTVPENIRQMQKEFLERLKAAPAAPGRSKKKRTVSEAPIPALFTRTAGERMRIITEKVALILIKETGVKVLDEFEAQFMVAYLDHNNDTPLWDMSFLETSTENRSRYYIPKLAAFISPTDRVVSGTPKNLRLPGRFLTPKKREPIVETPSKKLSVNDGHEFLNSRDQVALHDEAFNEFQFDWLIMLDNPIMSDIVIHTQSTHVPAHKLILHARCPKILEDLDDFGCLSWVDTSRAAAVCFLKFLYTGQLPRTPWLQLWKQEAKEVQYLAKQYCVETLNKFFFHPTDLNSDSESDSDKSVNRAEFQRPIGKKNLTHQSSTSGKSPKVVEIIEISSDDSIELENPVTVVPLSDNTSKKPKKSRLKLQGEKSLKRSQNDWNTRGSDEEDIPSPFKCTMLSLGTHEGSYLNPVTAGRQCNDDRDSTSPTFKRNTREASPVSECSDQDSTSTAREASPISECIDQDPASPVREASPKYDCIDQDSARPVFNRKKREASPISECSDQDPASPVREASPKYDCIDQDSAGPVFNRKKREASPISECSDQDPASPVREASPKYDCIDQDPAGPVFNRNKREASPISECIDQDSTSTAREASPISECSDQDPASPVREASPKYDCIDQDPAGPVFNRKKREASPISECSDQNPASPVREASPKYDCIDQDPAGPVFNRKKREASPISECSDQDFTFPARKRNKREVSPISDGTNEDSTSPAREASPISECTTISPDNDIYKFSVLMDRIVKSHREIVGVPVVKMIRKSLKEWKARGSDKNDIPPIFNQAMLNLETLEGSHLNRVTPQNQDSSSPAREASPISECTTISPDNEVYQFQVLVERIVKSHRRMLDFSSVSDDVQIPKHQDKKYADKFVTEALSAEVSDEADIQSPAKSNASDVATRDSWESSKGKQSSEDGISPSKESLSLNECQLSDSEPEVSQTDPHLKTAEKSCRYSPPKASTSNSMQDHKILFEDSFRFDLRTPPPARSDDVQIPEHQDKNYANKFVTEAVGTEVSDEADIQSPAKSDASDVATRDSWESSKGKQSSEDGISPSKESLSLNECQLSDSEPEVSQTDPHLKTAGKSCRYSPPKASTSNSMHDHKILSEDSFHFDLRTPPPAHPESATPIRTPLTDIKVSSPATPMPDYWAMNGEELQAELCKYGLKRNLPISKGIKMLRHIYRKLHPLVEVVVKDGREILIPIGDMTPVHRVDLPLSNHLSQEIPANENKPQEPPEDVHLLSDSSSDENEVMEESLFADEDNASYEGLSDLAAIVRAWIASNKDLQDKVLRYEPIQLESVHSELKEHTHQNIKLSHLMNILDDEGVIFRMAQKSTEAGRTKKQGSKRRKNVCGEQATQSKKGKDFNE